MVKYFIFFAKLALKQLRRFWWNLKVFKIHGLYLPEGAHVLKPENIDIGKDFGISPYCQFLCQDPESGSELVIGDRVALNHIMSS